MPATASQPRPSGQRPCTLALPPRDPSLAALPSLMPCRGHSSSLSLGSPLQPVAAAPWGLVPSPVLCVSSQEPVIWLYLHAQVTQSLAAGPSPAPTDALTLQKYIYNSQERQRGREKERQRLCLHASVQSSLLMRRIWLLVSRGVCPVG